MDIVLFSFDKLHGRVGRAHHFARHLARRHRVFFVDPLASLLGCRRLATTAEMSEDGIVHVVLSAGLPGRMLAPVHLLNEVRWLADVRKVLRRCDWGSRGVRVCLHMLPVWERAAAGLRPDVTVYDAHDNWRAMPRNPRRLTERLEAAHARSADIILAASDATSRNFAALGRQTHPMPNACDPDHFAQALTECQAKELADIPRPRITFIGGLEESFNTDAVLQVARHMRDTSFVIIGPEIKPQDALRSEPNVYLLSQRPYDELPSYLAGADVCWIPYRLTERVMGRDCIKLYEYLASGRPVVSVPLPRAVELANCLQVTDGTADGLIRACRAAMKDDTAEKRDARLALARRNSWANRVEQLESFIERFCATGRDPSE